MFLLFGFDSSIGLFSGLFERSHFPFHYLVVFFAIAWIRLIKEDAWTWECCAREVFDVSPLHIHILHITLISPEYDFAIKHRQKKENWKRNAQNNCCCCFRLRAHFKYLTINFCVISPFVFVPISMWFTLSCINKLKMELPCYDMVDWIIKNMLKILF